MHEKSLPSGYFYLFLAFVRELKKKVIMLCLILKKRHEIFGVVAFSALNHKIMIIFLNQNTQKTWVDQSVPDSHMYGAKTPLA